MEAKKGEAPETPKPQAGWVNIARIEPDGRVTMFPVGKMLFAYWKGPEHMDEGPNQLIRVVEITPEVLETLADQIHGRKSGIVLLGDRGPEA